MSSPIADGPSRKNTRILVVEDVDFNLQILTIILTDRGWQVVPATSGEAALDILARDAGFQVILMDIGLPGIDGIEATRRIKENPATWAIPVIALTAETAADQERFLTAGLDGYAEKNFDADQLIVAIERHLCPACRNRHAAGPALPDPAAPCDFDFEGLLAIYADEKALCRIARAFFADTDKELILLDRAMAADDQARILACCHSLSGSSTIFSAQTLTAAVKELEACSRHGKKQEAWAAWHRVRAAHESLCDSVRARLGLSGKTNLPS